MKKSTTMTTLENLSKEELLGLIMHEIPGTLSLGHPCQCASCGDSPQRTKTLHNRSWKVYWYLCDKCEGSD